MDSASKIVSFLAAIGIGLGVFYSGLNIGEKVGRNKNTPNSGYEKKIEGDERQYLIINTSGGDKFYMIKTPDGNFISLREFQFKNYNELEKKLSTQ